MRKYLKKNQENKLYHEVNIQDIIIAFKQDCA